MWRFRVQTGGAEGDHPRWSFIQIAGPAAWIGRAQPEVSACIAPESWPGGLGTEGRAGRSAAALRLGARGAKPHGRAEKIDVLR